MLNNLGRVFGYLISFSGLFVSMYIGRNRIRIKVSNNVLKNSPLGKLVIYFFLGSSQ